MKLQAVKRLLALSMIVATIAPTAVYAQEGMPTPVVEQQANVERSTETDYELTQEGIQEVPQTPEAPPTSEVVPSPEPEQPDIPPEVTPEPEQPDVPPEVTPEPEQPDVPPEVTPEPEQPDVPLEVTPEPEQPDVPAEVTPEPEQPDVLPETPTPETPNTVPEVTLENQVEATESDDTQETKPKKQYHFNYGKYFGHKKDLRKGFAKVDKAYAYAKVDTVLNIREKGNKNARVIGTLPKKAVCYVISDAKKDWVYIESGDVRGFVKSTYLQQGKKALKYVTKKGEDNVKFAKASIKPEDNKAFDYVTETVYDIKNGTGDGVVKFAKQFVGNPYVWGGNSLTEGIDCSHFVYQILTRCGLYDGNYTTSLGWRTLGEEVKSLEDAKAGDVVCYDGHVAFYDGNGKIVEAQGRNAGITDNRMVDSKEILTIRRFTKEEPETGSQADEIKDYLLDKGFSKAGIAGIMGNIANESYPAFEASSLELRSINKLGISSDEYTMMVDSGEISRDEVIRSSTFGLYSGGRYGYGLCGFTDPTVKEYLCQYTIDKGKSIGSVTGQLDGLLAYLERYNPSLLERLKNAKDPAAAASAFLREYEKCANIDKEEQERIAAAEDIYKQL